MTVPTNDGLVNGPVDNLLMQFFTLFGYQVGGGGGSPKGRVHNPLMQFFTPDSSKIEVFETCSPPPPWGAFNWGAGEWGPAPL